MDTTNKLIQLGWTDASGRSLEWFHWREKPRRVAVAYCVGVGKAMIPIYHLETQMRVRK